MWNVLWPGLLARLTPAVRRAWLLTQSVLHPDLVQYSVTVHCDSVTARHWPWLKSSVSTLEGEGGWSVGQVQVHLLPSQFGLWKSQRLCPPYLAEWQQTLQTALSSLSSSHYEKLRMALNEMEDRDIIRKSMSEYTSPLILVCKKNGDLRLCKDFCCWMHALSRMHIPHQADALAALGGNAFFSTMDLTSGYYNVEVLWAGQEVYSVHLSFWAVRVQQAPSGTMQQPSHVHEDGDGHLRRSKLLEPPVLPRWPCPCSQWTPGSVKAGYGVQEVKGTQP